MLKVKGAVEWREEWVAALRSGKYHQIRNMQGSPQEGMCAWGVFRWMVLGNEAYRDLSNHGTQTCRVSAIVGLTSDDATGIVALNDYRQATFSEIADYIEQLPYTNAT